MSNKMDNKTFVKEIEKQKKVIKNDWMMDKMARIAAMFDEEGKEELTSVDVMDRYRKDYGDIDDSTILMLLKRMTDEKLLRRERRSVKEYPNGHIKTVSKFFYRAAAGMDDKFFALDRKAGKKMDELVGMTPEFELAPPEMRGRPAFSTPTQLAPAEIEKEKAKAKERELREKIEKVKEITEPAEKKEPIGRTVQEMFSQMPFSEALVKLYQGCRIVSAVSGNIYSVVDKDNLKGITCSSKPGAIISFFPPNEMEGMWRELELPKNCPFCGSAVKLVEFKNEYMYKCTNEECRTIGPHALTPEDAVLKFNRRC